jgi:CitB family two-component system sensor histidine kinase MalK
MYAVISNFKISSEYEKTKEKYASTSRSLIEYEEMIDKYRVNNHENKNQLQMIRSMIKHGDKAVNNYIDDLLDTVYMANESLMMDVAMIPAGGLRATVYSKLVIMDNNNICHMLNIDHKLRGIDFFENNPEITLKVCNLLNIFIDNAIDEVNLQTEKNILLDIYLDDEKTAIFEITNVYVSDFDINRIYEKRYTTKSKGHGYGLALANEIIGNEARITNNTIVDDNLFTQKLIVNISTKKDKI